MTDVFALLLDRSPSSIPRPMKCVMLFFELEAGGLSLVVCWLRLMAAFFVIASMCVTY